MEKAYLISGREGDMLYYPEKDLLYTVSYKKETPVYVPQAIAGPIVLAICGYIGNLIAPLIFDIKYPFVFHTLAAICFGYVLYKYFYPKTVQKAIYCRKDEILLIEINERLKNDIIKVTLAGALLMVIIAYFILKAFLTIIYDVDKYMLLVIVYDIIFPFILVYGNFKGRYVLIKRLIEIEKRKAER